EQLIQRVWLDARLELGMKPIEHLTTMAALDFTACLPNGSWALPLCLQARAFFLQKDIGEHRQRPEAHNRQRAHQLIVIQAQFLFAIAKEHLDVEAAWRYATRAALGWLPNHWKPSSALVKEAHPRTDAQSPPESGTSCAPACSPHAHTPCPCSLAIAVACSRWLSTARYSPTIAAISSLGAGLGRLPPASG